jgi:hypothetical protein
VFYEQLAKLTRAHMQEHFTEYAALVNAHYDQVIQLDIPRTFEISTIVGGVVGISRDTMPAFAISANKRSFLDDDEDVWSYLYTGQISGMIGTTETAERVESMVRRYAGIFEMFIQNHRRLPASAAFDESQYPFRIKSFAAGDTEFLGAANLDEAENMRIWIDGFTIEIAWEVVEAGPGQHG